MLKKVLLFSCLVAIFTSFQSAFGQTVPSHTEFTADRMVCESKELDYKCITGHKSGPENGITVVSRPTLNISVIYLYRKSVLIETFITQGEIILYYYSGHPQFDLVNIDTYRHLVNEYFPSSIGDKFLPILQKCKEQEAH